MRIASILENQLVEKRIAITPEIAKKYIALGFEISLIEKYGEHLGFKDSDYKELGVEISTDKSEVLNSADIIIQLGLLSDKNLSSLKENQIIIGVFDSYNNKDNSPLIRKMLKDNNVDSMVIPYKENRAVIFNSQLFHETDDFDFNESYENRRINITFLYD